ncbi:hypothetical protein AVEN_135701-1 [Araneus ventricosus]|uniref:Uncharacterized protein n=1 Tax=Araneus ventricosus TaxID=182803 RepID=A0A4Y2JD93_ARAVE|nr:hypothetical protein AVEN_135701-1 [Araneus ventricosus]
MLQLQERIVLFQMLQHLQFVWVPHVSSQIAHETALTDSHLRRERSGPSCLTPAQSCVDVPSSAAIFSLRDSKYRRARLFPSSKGKIRMLLDAIH